MAVRAGQPIYLASVRGQLGEGQYAKKWRSLAHAHFRPQSIGQSAALDAPKPSSSMWRSNSLAASRPAMSVPDKRRKLVI